MARQASQVDKSPYAFTWNNPINLVDPDGLSPDTEMEDDRVTLYGKDGRALVSSFGEDRSNLAEGNDTPKEILKQSSEVKYQYDELENGDIQHTITETIKQEIWELLGNLVDVKKVTTQNIYTLTVSTETGNNKQITSLNESFTQKVSDIVQSTHTLVNHGLGMYSLGKTITEGHVVENGFDRNIQYHTSEKLWGYSEALKQEVYNDKSYNPYKGTKEFTLGTGIGGAGISYMLRKKPVTARSIAIGVLVGNAYRNFANHSGRSHTLEKSSKTKKRF